MITFEVIVAIHYNKRLERDIIQCFLKDAVPFKKELYTYLQVLRIKEFQMPRLE